MAGCRRLLLPVAVRSTQAMRYSGAGQGQGVETAAARPLHSTWALRRPAMLHCHVSTHAGMWRLFVPCALLRMAMVFPVWPAVPSAVHDVLRAVLRTVLCRAVQLFPELLKESPYVVDDPADADWFYVHVWPYYSQSAGKNAKGFMDKVRCDVMCCPAPCLRGRGLSTLGWSWKRRWLPVLGPLRGYPPPFGAGLENLGCVAVVCRTQQRAWVCRDLGPP